MDALTRRLTIHPDGWKFVGLFALATFFLFLLNEEIGMVGGALTLWCYYFFRNPTRVVPKDPRYIVSPADGEVVLIQKAEAPKDYGMEGERYRISVFLNVFDVHVNRSCVSGTVKGVYYHKGQFVNASFDKASDLNERNTVVIDMDNGHDLAMTQIAGLIARRIRCDLKKDDRIEKGHVYGLIRFGSRVDIYLPQGMLPHVCVGQRMIAGETILCDLYSKETTPLEGESVIG
jgi:phosphatidylserine decarboxylase